MNLCRLCGEKKSPLELSIELSDKTSSNWSYRDFIEHHTRVSLKTNKLLPQSICEECRAQVDGFVKFSSKIQEVQNGFDADELDAVPEIKECFVQVESLDEDLLTRVTRSQRKRKTKYNEEDERSKRQCKISKRGKFEAITIKIEAEVEVRSREESIESTSVKTEFKEESSVDDDDIPISKLKRRNSKVKAKSKKRKSRSSTSQKPKNSKEQSLYGPEVDTLEKLYEDEIYGFSKFPRLHLNVPEDCKLANGEVPEQFAQQVSSLRWKDIFACLICNLRFENILEMKKHHTEKHVREKVFGCHLCEGGVVVAGMKGGAISETSLLNHLVERHYFGHLLFCCMVCSKMFYDLRSLNNHYKSHDGEFYANSCFICGFTSKDLEALKYHKAQHMIKETSEKSDNLLLCEKIQDKFDRGLLQNPVNPLVFENERNADGTVSDECQRRLAVDWSFGTYNCPPCSLTYDNPFDLFVHTNLLHNPTSSKSIKKIYGCKECEIQKKRSIKQQFDQMFTFFNHAIDERHNENIQFSCIVCSKVFWNLLALVNHYKQVHPAFSCVPCNHCGRVFQNCAFASNHLNKEVAKDDEKIVRVQKNETFVCEICGFGSRKKGIFVSHRKMVHKLVKPEEIV